MLVNPMYGGSGNDNKLTWLDTVPTKLYLGTDLNPLEYVMIDCMTIPDGVTEISNHGLGYYGYSTTAQRNLNVRKIILPSGLKKIGDNAFSGSGALEEIVFPDSLESIGTQGIDQCKNLKKLILPNSLKTIGRAAFWLDDALETIVIPASVTSIGEEAISYCRKLANIYYRGSSTQWASITKGTDWNKGMGEYVSGGTKITYNYKG